MGLCLKFPSRCSFSTQAGISSLSSQVVHFCRYFLDNFTFIVASNFTPIPFLDNDISWLPIFVEDMKAYMRHSPAVYFEFSWLIFIINFTICAFIGLIVGLLHKYYTGLAVGLALFVFFYTLQGMCYYSLFSIFLLYIYYLYIYIYYDIYYYIYYYTPFFLGTTSIEITFWSFPAGCVVSLVVSHLTLTGSVIAFLGS